MNRSNNWSIIGHVIRGPGIKCPRDSWVTYWRERGNDWQGCRGCWSRRRPGSRGEHHLLELLSNNRLVLWSEVSRGRSVRSYTKSCMLRTCPWKMLRVTRSSMWTFRTKRTGPLPVSSLLVIRADVRSSTLLARRANESRSWRGCKTQGHDPCLWSS